MARKAKPQNEDTSISQVSVDTSTENVVNNEATADIITEINDDSKSQITEAAAQETASSVTTKKVVKKIKPKFLI